MQSKKFYLLLFLLFYLSFNKNSFAQIQINTTNLNLCNNFSGSLFLLGNYPSNSTFQWQDSTSNGWSNIVNSSNFIGVNNDTLFVINANSLINGLKLRCIVDSAGLTQSLDTSNSSNLTVYSQILSPKIRKSQVICYSSITDTIEAILPATGADGNFSYQWQISNNLNSFIDINGANSLSLQLSNLIDSIYYLRLRATSIFGCGIVYSDTISIRVLRNITKPQITSSQNICLNSQADTLKMIHRAKGSNGIFNYQWQESINGINWQYISLANDTFLSLNGLSSTKYFRIVAFNICDTIYSDSVKILIYDKLNPGIIKSNQNICFNTRPQVLSFLSLPSGANGIYNYKWQVSGDSINFTDIANASSTIYQPSILTSTKYYRLKVSTSCGTDYSNIIKVNVFDEFFAPVITTNIDTICYGNTSDSIFISSYPIGANGIYSYQWEYSLDSINWNNISLANAVKFTSGRLFQTTFFRLLVASNCGVKYSNVKKIFVYTKINRPVLSPNQSICYNTSPDTIRIIVPATGADNQFVYSWYQSSDGINWTLISNVNSLKYNPGKLSKSVYYKVVALNAKLCSASSDSIFVKVYDEFKSGVISNNQTVCYFAETDTMKFTQLPTGAENSYSYQWQVSTDSINFTNIISSTNTSFKAPATDHTKYYRVKVTSLKGCGVLYTNIIKIKVYEKYIGAVVSGNDTICKDSIPNRIVTVSLPKGGSLQYFYQWQKSIDEINWTNIPNATFNYYQAPKLYNTTFYRLINFSGMNCGADTSNIIKILVQDLPDTTEIVGYTEVCKNQQELYYRLHKTNDQYKYRWFVDKAEILTDDESNAVFLNWGELTGNDTIRVLQFNKVTGCYNYMLLPIIIKEDRAPDKTKIIRKSTTNILICEDSSANISYQWGYIEKGTTLMQDILNANLRYVLLPHNFDTTKYVYYVKTIFNGCVTNTFYNYYDPLIFNSTQTEKLKINLYPNPSNGTFKLSGIPTNNFKLFIYDVLGKAQFYNLYGDEFVLENSTKGVYFVVLYYKNKMYTQRIIVE